jgi:hypothetical protein
MPYTRLNRDGRESFRNLAKPYRPQREVFNKKTGRNEIHPMDRMRLGPTDKELNSTGCFGSKNTFSSVSMLSTVVKRGAPGRERPPRKKKNVCKLIPGHKDTGRMFTDAMLPQLVELRTDLLFCRTAGNLIKKKIISDEYSALIEKIAQFLVANFPEKRDYIFGRDTRIIKGVIGMHRSNKVKFRTPKSIDQRVARALHNMGIKREERSG